MKQQFRRGHRYISSLVDLEGGRVLDVVEERTEEAAKAFIDKGLTAVQQTQGRLQRWTCGKVLPMQ